MLWPVLRQELQRFPGLAWNLRTRSIQHLFGTVQVSERVQATDAPCIVKTKQLMQGVEGVLSLAQGIVHQTGSLLSLLYLSAAHMSLESALPAQVWCPGDHRRPL